ncbi:PDC sensor domain-containing protein, partial [Vibrio parahaemolyticus]
DRTYFKAALADRSGGLHVGVPLRNRVTANWILPLARALRGPDGQVVAVVGASLSIDYFREALGATLPAGGRIQLLRDD